MSSGTVLASTRETDSLQAVQRVSFGYPSLKVQPFCNTDPPKQGISNILAKPYKSPEGQHKECLVKSSGSPIINAFRGWRKRKASPPIGLAGH